MRGYSIYGRLRKEGDPLRLVLDGVLPPLLTPEEADAFDTVQATLLANNAFGGEEGSRHRQTNPHLQQKTTLLCAGLARCAVCGAPLRSHAQADPTHSDGRPRLYRSYVCSGEADGTAKFHPTARAASRTMSVGQDKLDAAVVYALAQISLLIPELPVPQKSKSGMKDKRQPRPKRTVEQIGAVIDTLVELRSEGKIAEADYLRKYDALTQERADVLAWQQEQATAGEQEQGLALLAEQNTGVSDQTPPLATLRLILRLLVDRVEVPVRGVTGADVTRKRSPGSGRERTFARVHLKSPLPDGTTAILSGLYRSNYTGQRLVIFERHTMQTG